LAATALELIGKLELLNEGGLIIVEHGADEILDTKNFDSIRKLTYGKTTCVEILAVNGSD